MARPDTTPTQARGASTAGVDWRAILHAWRQHHRLSATNSARQLLCKPLQTVMTALVIGITLALPALFVVAIENIQSLGRQWDGAPRLSVFLRKDTQATTIQSLVENLSRQQGVTAVEHIPPEQGLQELEKQMGVEGTLELLDHNPLPSVLAVTFDPATTADALEAVRTQWQTHTSIESIDADLAWVRKLHHWLDIGRQLTTGLAALLGLGALLSVGNTIRLAIENNRAEIVVAKLVGATDAYVRRPFLYTGLWYGAAGGVIAVLLVAGSCMSLSGPIADMAALYQSTFSLQGLSIASACGLVGIGMALGVIGAWLAVGQHLHDMRPR